LREGGNWKKKDIGEDDQWRGRGRKKMHRERECKKSMSKGACSTNTPRKFI